MADQSDVETALAAQIEAVVYPPGTGDAGLGGLVGRVYRGWPNPAALDADLAAGVVNITVFPLDDARNTTRYFDTWMVPDPVPVTLAVIVAGETVSFSGSAASGQLAGVLADNAGYIYRTRTGDTPALVAANIAVALRTKRIAQLSGASVTIPGVGRLFGRAVADQSALWQVRRQRQDFRITCWCPDYASRDAVAAAVDVALAQQHFLALADGSRGQLVFVRSQTSDAGENATLYRRDLIYAVEYPTTVIQTLPSMLFGDLALGNGAGIITSLLD